MRHNRGLMIEEEMKKWFRGKGSSLDCVDFKTKTTLYEVKSCQIIVKCKHNPGNYEHQLGRFSVFKHNHEDIHIEAMEKKMNMKYIFVITIGRQRIWRTMNWEDVNRLVKEDKPMTKLTIRDVFGVL